VKKHFFGIPGKIKEETEDSSDEGQLLESPGFMQAYQGAGLHVFPKDVDPLNRIL